MSIPPGWGRHVVIKSHDLWYCAQRLARKNLDKRFTERGTFTFSTSQHLPTLLLTQIDSPEGGGL